MGDYAISDHPGVQSELSKLEKIAPGGGDTLGLERITALLEKLGRPHDRLPPVFHVAGTNGKGSTCAFLRYALEAAGYTAHVFTSPHLVRFNERIRVAGKLIGDDELADILGEVRIAGQGIGPSFFEATTAAAFLAFSRTAADACIIEVGLGGRLDATNVIEQPIATGIASIGHDHEHMLGSTLAKIAAEKAGIAKAGVPLISVAQPDDAEQTIRHVAKERGARLLIEGHDWHVDTGLAPALPGEWQLQNANLARAMVESQSAITISDEDVRRGIRHARWPARFQSLSPGPLTGHSETWLDGAHNAEAAAALAGQLARTGPMHLVIGIIKRKEAERIIDLLKPHALSLTFVPVPGQDFHDPMILAERHGGRAAPSLTEALSDLPGPRLIAGSLYLAGEALRLNEEFPD